MHIQILGRGTADIFNGVDSKAARKVCPVSLHRLAARKLQAINAATALADLQVPPGNKLHALAGDRAGQHAIRINDQYRICFQWAGDEAIEVQVTDYH